MQGHLSHKSFLNTNGGRLNYNLLSELLPDYYKEMDKAITDYVQKSASSDFSLPGNVNQLKVMFSNREREIYNAYQIAMKDANSVTVDLNMNTNNINNIQLITKRIRTTTYGSHVFYLSNNSKDTLSDEKLYFFGIGDDDNENGNLFFYLVQNHSYFIVNPKDYYNQEIGKPLKIDFLLANDVIAFLVAPGEISIFDKGVEVGYKFVADRYFKTSEGGYSKFSLFKNETLGRTYFISNSIFSKDSFGKYNLYQPYYIYAR
ncbi:MAG: hypothetical protein NVSMB45_17750 [Ginsengibacter sp.]